MSNLQKAIDILSDNIMKYRQSQQVSGDEICEYMRQISGILFYLETERAMYHDSFQNKVNELVLAGDSVARSENKAHVEVPEMYKLRRIMDSAYSVLDAMRSQLSWLKQEKNISQ